MMHLPRTLLLLSFASLFLAGCATPDPDAKPVQPPREESLRRIQDPNQPVSREEFIRVFGK